MHCDCFYATADINIIQRTKKYYVNGFTLTKLPNLLWHPPSHDWAEKWCCNVLIQWTLNQQHQEDAEGTAVISNHTYKAINSWVGNCELAIFITIKVTSVILIKDRHHMKFSLSFIVGNLISKITRTKLSTAELGPATWRSFHDSFSFCRDTTLKDWYLWSSLNPLTIFHMLYTNLGPTIDMLILSPDQNPLYRPSPTSPAGPTFYVDLTTPDGAVKEAMEGNNIQVWVKMAICPFYDPIFLLSLTSFLTSKWSAKLTGLSHIPQGDWTLITFLFISSTKVGWDGIMMMTWAISSTMTFTYFTLTIT